MEPDLRQIALSAYKVTQQQNETIRILLSIVQDALSPQRTPEQTHATREQFREVQTKISEVTASLESLGKMILPLVRYDA